MTNAAADIRFIIFPAAFYVRNLEMDCSFLSDEACLEGWFTGAMTGLCCQDMTCHGKYADFDWFIYDPEEK